MKPLTSKSEEVIERMISEMEDNHAKIDHTNGAFKPVSIKWVGKCSMGPILSIAHYDLSNGDIMCDPEMEFVRDEEGRFYAISFKNDYVGFSERPVKWVLGELVESNTERQKADRDFADGWMLKIWEQQYAR